MSLQKFIQALKRKGIIASLGHSCASYEETRKAMSWGLNHFTHFFNAMQGFHHREPRAVGAGLETKSITMELIVDGFHVYQAAIRLLAKLKGDSAICLVTDAIRAAGMLDGVYEFCGKQVLVEGGKAVLSMVLSLEQYSHHESSCEKFQGIHWSEYPRCCESCYLKPSDAPRVR